VIIPDLSPYKLLPTDCAGDILSFTYPSALDLRLARRRGMAQTDILASLADSEFFKDLEAAHTQDIAGLCQSMTYQSGESVFQQGDVGEYIYIIAEGQVILERAMDLGIRKGNVAIDLLGKGRVMGSWLALLDEPHLFMCSATCRKTTTVLRLKGRDLRKIMVSDKELGFRLMERFCRLLRERVQAAYGALERI
jgi:CRP-like cAMP-binding protein